MFFSIEEVVLVAIAALIIGGIWLLRRSSATYERPTEKLQCRSCGQAFSAGAKFCGRCGAKLT